jgi:hypothetical protein
MPESYHQKSAYFYFQILKLINVKYSQEKIQISKEDGIKIYKWDEKCFLNFSIINF